MFQKFWLLTKAHKIAAGIIIILLIVFGYYGIKALKGNNTPTTYVLAAVEKGTLISSIIGSGQVSASNQVELKPKASGEIYYLGVKQGQEVKAGTLIASLDASDALKSVRDAQDNLASAKLSLEKLKAPASAITILQAENSLTQAKDSLAKLKQSQPIDYQKAVDTLNNAESDLVKDYDDAFNSISDTFVDLPGIVSGLFDVIYSATIDRNSSNIDAYVNAVKEYAGKIYDFRLDVVNGYNSSKKLYDQTFASYKATSRTASQAVIESLLDETYDTTVMVADTIKNMNNLIQFYKDILINHSLTPKTIADTHLATLNSYTSKANGFLTDLLAMKNTLVSDKQSVIDAKNAIAQLDQNNPRDLATAERSVKEKEITLANLKAGPDTYDLKSQEMTLKQRENALTDARQNLADYSVRAPFDGIVAKVDVAKGDTASSGTAIATLITKKQIAEIPLNELDAAKVKTGQKATLTFDAVEDLSISGEVIQIDTLGTVSQGVVTYNMQIGFDTDDARVKPGMSVTAAVILEAKQDVIMARNSAIKTFNGVTYVEMPNETVAVGTNSTTGIELKQTPKQQTIETGISNDTYTEVTSGLNEGDQVIVRTNNSTTSATQTQGQSILSSFGRGGAGGGMPR